MRRGWVGAQPAVAAAAVIIAAAGIAGPAAAAGKKSRSAPTLSSLAEMAAHRRAQHETITFSSSGAGVRLFRGAVPAGANTAPPSTAAQVIRFGGHQVRILRGGPAAPMASAARPAETAPRPETAATMRIQRVNFAGATVTVMRGLAAAAPATVRRPPDDPDIADLFGPADADELDRVAFAVEGAESSHGADLRMWRPEAEGPQGPMQVSAAAALDVGGGDRFDLSENRVLGRAYLERMFRRYGNWPDALKAYNWGPGNLDQWIAGGRDPDRLPIGVAHYVSRVLRDALMHTTTAGL